MELLPENIMQEIESRKLVPIPRWRFLLERAVFWVLALISVAVGALSFAVADYVFFDNDGMSVASIQQSSIQDIARSIPYVWLFMLAVFTGVAYFGFRRTRKGYQYATAGVVAAAILGSVALGLVLNSLDFGQSVHKYLLSHTDFYDPLIRSSEDTAD